MATPSGTRQERVIHQDYIVRQRYGNALPPPPGCPAILDIPIPGIEAYTSPAYASRLARAGPMNIEPDADLGMPIDLVGIRGIFDGDESAIMAPEIPPPVHPRDRSLLRPLKSLGKPKTQTQGVSFLRRTQYTAEDLGRRAAANATNNKVAQPIRKKKPEAAKEDPLSIVRDIAKGFDIANPEDAYKGPDTTEIARGAVPTADELKAWKNPVHPTNPNLKVVDTYDMLPDLDAITESQGFVVVKLAGQPTEITNAHDERLDVALLQPHAPPVNKILEYQEKNAAHEADPARFPVPQIPEYKYDLFLPGNQEIAQNIKKSRNPANMDKDDPSLYTFKSKGSQADSFAYEHVRQYETGMQTDNTKHPFQEVALALHDPDLEAQMAGVQVAENGASRKQKAAYYYPVTQKSQLKPSRTKHLAQMGLAGKVEEEEAMTIDRADLSYHEATEEEKVRREQKLAEMEGTEKGEEE